MWSKEQKKAIADAIFDNDYAAMNRLKEKGMWPPARDADRIASSARCKCDARAEAFRACIELLESRKRYWDGGDLARVGEYSNFVKELDHLIEQMESVRDGKDGRP